MSASASSFPDDPIKSNLFLVPRAAGRLPKGFGARQGFCSLLALSLRLQLRFAPANWRGALASCSRLKLEAEAEEKEERVLFSSKTRLSSC